MELETALKGLVVFGILLAGLLLLARKLMAGHLTNLLDVAGIRDLDPNLPPAELRRLRRERLEEKRELLRWRVLSFLRLLAEEQPELFPADILRLLLENRDVRLVEYGRWLFKIRTGSGDTHEFTLIRGLPEELVNETWLLEEVAKFID